MTRIPTEQYTQGITAETANQLAELFKTLGDPTRLRIVALLMTQELTVQAIADALAISQSAISHQLRILRQLRLVRFRKNGRNVFYALDDDHIRILFEQGLQHVEHG
jgi:ArsR family transcriptional regulator, lead/cadmium/zinc/bismuth-responsive transcriptional repressor